MPKKPRQIYKFNEETAERILNFFETAEKIPDAIRAARTGGARELKRLREILETAGQNAVTVHDFFEQLTGKWAEKIAYIAETKKRCGVS